jgi:hypothetical protein
MVSWLMNKMGWMEGVGRIWERCDMLEYAVKRVRENGGLVVTVCVVMGIYFTCCLCLEMVFSSGSVPDTDSI